VASRPVHVFLACALFGCALYTRAAGPQPSQAPPIRVPNPIRLNSPAISKTDLTPPEIQDLRILQTACFIMLPTQVATRAIAKFL
jgi:hypothetical protein